MTRLNAFEAAHQSDLKKAETAALKALKAIVEDTAVRPSVRVAAARTILDVRSQDAR